MIESPANSLSPALRPFASRFASTLPPRDAAGPRPMVKMGTLESPAVALVSRWLKPLVVVAVLYLSVLVHQTPITTELAGMGLIALLLSAHVLSPLNLKEPSTGTRQRWLQPLLEWMWIAASLSLLAVTLKVTQRFPEDTIVNWFIASPIALLAVEALSTSIAQWLAARSPGGQRHIIIGINDVGLELARRVKESAGLGEFRGFFDHRSADRLPEVTRHQLIGHCKDVADYVRRHAIDTVYIALPISTAPRIAELLNELRDTTASVFFVPNLFAFDLMQACCIDINGMPVLSICDTPLRGMSGMSKRIADLALATAALAMVWPIMLTAAIAVRLSSTGPIFFKQRRYGLNGEEILVYKFRSMIVCENGTDVKQATRDDTRITAVGRFLRRTSIDELPQIFNVFEGKMSFVGPRPHAVAHNEQYRKLIRGYMLRHKVRPGITGWAQVNGLRGETDTIDKMEARVRYDLEYLKHWSIWFDLKIILKTALLVIRDRNAY